MAKKTKLTKQRLIELFMDSVLENNETPKSVYAFAKINHFLNQGIYLLTYHLELGPQPQ